MGGVFDKLTKIKALFILVYGLTFFLSNAGPNTTTFVVPSEVFPTEFRATCHGLSAAAGKLGAVVGVVLISYLLSDKAVSTNVIFYINGGIALIAAILTYFTIPETLNVPLDALILHNSLSNL